MPGNRRIARLPQKVRRLAEDLAEFALPAVANGSALVDQPAGEALGPIADDEGQAGLHASRLERAGTVNGPGAAGPIEGWWLEIGTIGAQERFLSAGQLVVGEQTLLRDKKADAERPDDQAQHEQQRCKGVEQGTLRHRGLLSVGW